MKNFSFSKIKVIYPMVFFYPFLFKLFYVEEYIFGHTAQRLFGTFQVFFHDSLIYFVMLLLFYISFFKRAPKPLSFLLRVASIGIFVVYVIDIAVLEVFDTRFTVVDFLKYGGYAPTFISILYQGLHLWFVVFCFIVFVALIISFFFQNFTLARRTHVVFLLTLSILALSSCWRDDKGDIYSWVYKNIAEYNSIMMSQNSFYTEKFINNVIANTLQKENVLCIKHTPQRKNIIILMVESFSLYQSKFFSVINDWTPNKDAIAVNKVSLTNF
jgi:hypothetical protein